MYYEWVWGKPYDPETTIDKVNGYVIYADGSKYPLSCFAALTSNSYGNKIYEKNMIKFLKYFHECTPEEYENLEIDPNTLNDTKSGFSAKLYKANDSDNYVLVPAGKKNGDFKQIIPLYTEPFKGGDGTIKFPSVSVSELDMKNNSSQAFGQKGPQHEYAIKLVKDLLREGIFSSDNLVLGGHSMAGSIVASAAAINKIQAVTINSAGVSPFTLWRHNTPLSELKKYVTSFSVEGELLTYQQEREFFRGLLVNAGGNRIVIGKSLPPMPSMSDPMAWFKEALYRHSNFPLIYDALKEKYGH